MKLQQFYLHLGGSYDALLSRLLTEERIKKFILMFKNDQTINELESSIKEKDFDAAFRSSHTMKGLAANLEFGDLQRSASELTEILRNYNGEDITQAYAKVKEEYNKVISGIDELE